MVVVVVMVVFDFGVDGRQIVGLGVELSMEVRGVELVVDVVEGDWERSKIEQEGEDSLDEEEEEEVPSSEKDGEMVLEEGVNWVDRPICPCPSNRGDK